MFVTIVVAIAAYGVVKTNESKAELSTLVVENVEALVYWGYRYNNDDTVGYEATVRYCMYKFSDNSFTSSVKHDCIKGDNPYSNCTPKTCGETF